MLIRKQSLGVDVDSKELKVKLMFCLENGDLKIKASRTFKNTAKGFAALLKWLRSKAVKNLCIHVVMEATGVYYENLAYCLKEEAEIAVHVVLPNMSSAYIKSLNVKSKTDEIDAGSLAQLGLERKLSIWEPGSAQMRRIKKLSRERLQLLDARTVILNQLHAEQASHSPDKEIIKRKKSRLKFINKQIVQIEKELELVVDQDKVLKTKVKGICKCPGLGFITVVGILGETDGFATIRNKNQLVSYAGYDVVKRESGTSIKGKTRISKKGNSVIRRILYMPAMSAAVHNQHYKKQYTRIAQKTTIKMKGNVAIQRKLLLLIYALYKKNEAYDPLHHQRMAENLMTKQSIKLQGLYS